jgi:hypothetical protein
MAGKEFGIPKGQMVIIYQALYGVKSSGATWGSHLAASITSLGFKSCLATKPNGTTYYKYRLAYVDDILVFSHASKVIMEEMGKLYRL